jgi:hypothetical protein
MRRAAIGNSIKQSASVREGDNVSSTDTPVIRVKYFSVRGQQLFPIDSDVLDSQERG